MPQTIDNMSVTWTNSLTTYTGIKLNAAGSSDANSAAGSLLMDLQVGGSSKFRVSKNGTIGLSGNEPISSFSINDPTGTARMLQYNLAGSNGVVYWGDLILGRRAAANLRLGAADAAGSAIAISSVASNQLTLASNHGLTTGAAIIITGSVAPSGTALNVRYYARVISAAVIELYSTYDHATAASGTTGRISVTTAGTSASVRLATPFQSFGVQDFTGTDIPGQPFIIRGSRGTGTGAGGDIIFQVAPAGSSGTAQNALATALTINSATQAIFSGPIAFQDVNGTVMNSEGFAIATGRLGWRNGVGTSVDLVLTRDAANTLALRNGAAAQTFRVYNTTDGTNSEFGSIDWTSNTNFLTIRTNKTGSGGSRGIIVQSADKIYFAPGGGPTSFRLENTGDLVCGADNQYDIGATSSGRPRNVYVAGDVTAAGAVVAGASQKFQISGRLNYSSPASGVAEIRTPTLGAGTVYLGQNTVANLPSASSYAGALAFVSDATATTARSTVAGGGSNKVMVMSDGTNWLIVA